MCKGTPLSAPPSMSGPCWWAVLTFTLTFYPPLMQHGGQLLEHAWSCSLLKPLHMGLAYQGQLMLHFILLPGSAQPQTCPSSMIVVPFTPKYGTPMISPLFS